MAGCAWELGTEGFKVTQDLPLSLLVFFFPPVLKMNCRMRRRLLLVIISVCLYLMEKEAEFQIMEIKLELEF